MRAESSARLRSATPNADHPTSVRGELANLDTLRAFAVTAVLADHIILVLTCAHRSNPLLEQFAMRLGRLGVVAFFVHTCVVLMFSLERLGTESRHPTLEFYVRRAFRIYPLSIATVILASLFRMPPLPYAPPCAACYTPANVLANFLLVQNAFGSSVIGPLWSLPYEVLMYLLLPAVFAVATGARALGKIAGMTACAALVSVLAHPRGGTLWFVDFVPCFLSGVLAYAFERRVRAQIHPAGWPALVAVVMTLGAAASVRWWQEQIYIGWTASFALGATLFLFRDSANRGWNRIARRVATYSYGIYLLHVPSLWLVFQILGVSAPLAGVALSLAITAGGSVAAYHALEYPMMRRGKELARALGARTAALRPRAVPAAGLAERIAEASRMRES